MTDLPTSITLDGLTHTSDPWREVSRDGVDIFERADGAAIVPVSSGWVVVRRTPGDRTYKVSSHGEADYFTSIKRAAEHAADFACKTIFASPEEAALDVLRRAALTAAEYR